MHTTRALQRRCSGFRSGATLPDLLHPNTAIVNSAFSPGEALRYARHFSLPGVGVEGQQRLRAARVLLVGAGGLGSPVALYLAAAGVGTLGIVDPDVVDPSNLQRQVLHGTASVGRLKTESARERIADANPHVAVEVHSVAVSAANARALVREYDVVVDGTDNFTARYLINDACVLEGRPVVYGAILRWEGQASVFAAEGGPCYRCLFPDPPAPGSVPSCAEGGVLGVLPGIIGSIQAAETLKLLLGVGETLVGRVLLFDALRMSFREMRLRRNPACPACGQRRTITEPADVAGSCTPATDTSPMANPGVPEITVTDLKERLDRGEPVAVIDVREPWEWELGNLAPYGARLIPLGQLADRIDELDPEVETVLQCRSGARSADALLFLQANGFRHLYNLKGGILAWAGEVDPSLPRY